MVCGGMTHLLHTQGKTEAEENTLLWVVGRSPGEQSMASRAQQQRELATSKRAPAPGLGFRDSIQVMWIEEIVFGGENRDWHE